jgi:glycosyltransferase involved in cell wall biosynthesis
MRSMFRPESVVFCNPTSPENFAQAIIDLHQHPEKCSRLVANAAEDYTPYQWEAMAGRYQQLLALLSRKQIQKQYPTAPNPL